MFSGILNKPADHNGLLKQWWPLLSGAGFGLLGGMLIYLLIAPLPHRPGIVHLGTVGCDVLRNAGFAVEPQANTCLFRGTYRESSIPGFISIRQEDRELQLSLSEVTAIMRVNR